MGGQGLVRTLIALLVMAGGAAIAFWLGAGPAAIAIVLAAGLASGALVLRDGPRQPLPPLADETPPSPPSAADLLDAVDEPLLIVRDRRVLLANEAARRLLGEHIEGVDARLAIRHPAAAEALAGAAASRTEIAGIGEPGQQWLMAVSSLPDDSRLVRLSDQSAARAAEQIRADFVANASHELRTPLATLLGFLETLEDEDAAGDPATRTRFLKIMAGEASRMRDLVDDLMSLSRIEADRFTAPREPVALAPLIDEVRRALAHLADARGAKIVVEDEAAGVVVAGDRSQLGQMLNNLISNALKYGREGAPVRVRVARTSEDIVGITIADQGEGIAEEHLPRLTERFYRVDPSRSRQVGGTGLGLAIVKHIVLRHRGLMQIRSVPGEGTEVRVELPVDQGHVTQLSQS